MKKENVAILSPLCFCLFAGSAWADMEPFTLGASETAEHQSNINHSNPSISPAVADWLFTTELNASVNQSLGRDAFIGSAAVDFNHYRHTHALDGTGYQAAAEFDWNTVGDLSGAFGADSHRRQYVSGETAEVTGTNPSAASEINVRNLQTDNHVFAKIALGGDARWQIFGGMDANERNFSNEAFKIQNERQWSANAGTHYATSPDLNFGLVGSYVNGYYPTGGLNEARSNFNSKSADITTKWKASGSSTIDASAGITSEDNDALGGTRHFANGSLNLSWKPPSHFGVNLGLKRSSDADTSSTGVSVGVVNANNLNDTSINNVALLDVTYELTAKVNLDATVDYTQRKYSNLQLFGSTTVVSGSTRTSRFYLTAHYQPTRTTDLSCGGGREVRRADAALNVGALLPSYTDNYLQCAAAIHFD